MPPIDKLLFAAELDIKPMLANIASIEKNVGSLGKFATNTFDKTFGRELAKSLDPKIPSAQLDKILDEIEDFSDDAKKTFAQTFGRRQAQEVFKPFIKESETFTGKLKAALGGGVKVEDIVLGAAAGIGVAQLVSNVSAGITKTLELAKNAEETRSKFNEVFKDISDITRIWANSFADDVGRSRVSIEEWLSSFTATLEPIGFVKEEAIDLSKELVSRAVDVGSFFNRLDKDVIQDFKAALAGSTETVDKYGIIIRDATLEQKALELGLNKTSAQLTEQEKVFLRYKIIIDSTTSAQGDAIRTADSYANQLKRLESNIENIGDTLGQSFVPRLSEALQIVNQFITELSSTDFEKTIRQLTGETSTTEKQQLTALNQQLELRNRLLEIRKQELEVDTDIFSTTTRILENLKARATGSLARLIDPDAKNNVSIFTEDDLNIANSILADIEEMVKGNADINAFQETSKQINQEIDKAIKSQLFHLNSSGDASESFAALSKSRAEALKLVSKEIEKIIGLKAEEIQISAQIDNIEKGLKSTRTEQQKQADKALERQARLQKFLNGLRTVSIEKAKELVRLNKEFSKEGQSLIKKLIAEAKAIDVANKATVDLANRRAIASENDEFKKRLLLLDIEKQKLLENAKASIDAQKRITSAFLKEREAILSEQFSADLAKKAFRELSNIKLEEIDVETLLRPILNIDIQSNIESEAIKVSAELKSSLSDILDPFDRFFGSLDAIGLGIDSEFFDLADKIQAGLGNLLSNVANFGDSLDQFAQGQVSVFGVINSGIGLVSSILGFGKKNEELERERIEREREAAAATREFEASLRSVEQALKDASAAEVQSELSGISESIKSVVGDFLDISAQDFDEFVKINRLITQLEAEATRFPDDLGIQEELQRLRDSISGYPEVLGALTEAQRDALRDLLQLQDRVTQGRDDFTAFGTSFSDLLSRIETGFNLFDVDDPTERLRIFEEQIKEAFGFDFSGNIQDFLSDGFDALKSGGQDLIDFLASQNLEELTADGFKSFLEAVKKFNDDLAVVGDETGDAAGKTISQIISDIELSSSLLGIDDPTKKIKKLQSEILSGFDALIPATSDGLKSFIENAAKAIQNGTLEQFRVAFGLEEVTDEAFKSLLSTLDGFKEDIDKISEVDAENAEAITKSFLKTITLGQANQLIQEASTSRIILTQMLEIFRDGGFGQVQAQNINVGSIDLLTIENEVRKIRDLIASSSGETAKVDLSDIEIDFSSLERELRNIGDTLESSLARIFLDVSSLNAPENISIDGAGIDLSGALKESAFDSTALDASSLKSLSETLDRTVGDLVGREQEPPEIVIDTSVQDSVSSTILVIQDYLSRIQASHQTAIGIQREILARLESLESSQTTIYIQDEQVVAESDVSELNKRLAEKAILRQKTIGL